ncbi:MAG: hypothetical protein K0R90_1736, partial [Oscillospiraceae bacterium]|nr:hypothetical protein [Oscillospiraceae bacterium]
MFDTKILKPTKENLLLCAKLLKDGELIGMPTETVYGLAANAFDGDAVKKIFKAKGRPQDNPLIVHISDISMLGSIAAKVPKLAHELAERFWPGPLTIILPKAAHIPLAVTAGLDTVAVRIPSHEVAKELIKCCEFPLAAPSANLSGSPSPTKAEHVFQDLQGRIPFVIDGGECEIGLESTVVTLSEDTIKILRPGGVTVHDLLQVTPNVHIDQSVLSQLEPNQKVSSPGMKYKHYSPKAKVV